jgi:heme-degrading monooxygenase HmoA
MTAVYLRVWEYEVLPEHVEAFTSTYGADGAWAELFGQIQGYLGTELYRSLDLPDRFITVDRWTDEASWHAFQDRFRTAYLTLDDRTHHLTVEERALLEGDG